MNSFNKIGENIVFKINIENKKYKTRKEKILEILKQMYIYIRIVETGKNIGLNEALKIKHEKEEFQNKILGEKESIRSFLDSIYQQEAKIYNLIIREKAKNKEGNKKYHKKNNTYWEKEKMWIFKNID